MKIFSQDGYFIRFLQKTGELIFVSLAFWVCCIPVVTAGASATSLYYATMKSVRKERGYPVQEFMHSMKRVWLKGSILTLAFLVWFAALLWGRAGAVTAAAQGGTGNGEMIYNALLVLSIGIVLYVFPVLSRFEMKSVQIVKLSFVMCLRFLPVTLLVAGGIALVGWLQFYCLPVPCILFLPGVCCFFATLVMEKALQHFMPEPEEGEDAWYYDDVNQRKQCNKHSRRRKEVKNEKV